MELTLGFRIERESSAKGQNGRFVEFQGEKLLLFIVLFLVLIHRLIRVKEGLDHVVDELEELGLQVLHHFAEDFHGVPPVGEGFLPGLPQDHSDD